MNADWSSFISWIKLWFVRFYLDWVSSDDVCLSSCEEYCFVFCSFEVLICFLYVYVNVIVFNFLFDCVIRWMLIEVGYCMFDHLVGK